MLKEMRECDNEKGRSEFVLRQWKNKAAWAKLRSQVHQSASQLKCTVVLLLKHIFRCRLKYSKNSLAELFKMSYSSDYAGFWRLKTTIWSAPDDQRSNYLCCIADVTVPCKCQAVGTTGTPATRTMQTELDYRQTTTEWIIWLVNVLYMEKLMTCTVKLKRGTTTKVSNVTP